MYVVNSNCIDCSDNITLASRVMMKSSRRYRANVCRGNIVIKKKHVAHYSKNPWPQICGLCLYIHCNFSFLLMCPFMQEITYILKLLFSSKYISFCSKNSYQFKRLSKMSKNVTIHFKSCIGFQ